MANAAVDAMINGQLKPNEVNDPAILDAIRSIPRENFLPKAKRGVAYIDEDIEVRGGRYLMEPMIFARLLVAAQVKPSDMVLDIGGVSGYSAAVLSRLAESVLALENDEALVALIEDKLQALDVVNVVSVKGVLADGSDKHAPFDVIFINGAVGHVPDALKSQLSDGGRLVTVLTSDTGVGRAFMITRRGDVFAERVLFDANVVPVPGFEKATAFSF